MATSGDQAKFLQDVALLVQWAFSHDFKLTGGHLYRTEEEQQRMVNLRLSKTMDSRHRVRCAIDLNIWYKGDPVWTKPADECHNLIAPLGEFWESLSEKNSWGVRRREPDWDEMHFERKE